jgi:Spy/CpxP family protein refolding chaperone
MKTWIRRTLIGVFGATALFGGLAAWAGHSYGHHSHGGDPAEMKARMVDFASRKLDLDAMQRAKLEALANTLQAQRQALKGDVENPRAELGQLISGPSFDRTQASALLQTKLSAVQLKSPEVINAFGDFYDSLRAEQQAKLREALARGRHHGARG